MEVYQYGNRKHTVDCQLYDPVPGPCDCGAANAIALVRWEDAQAEVQQLKTALIEARKALGAIVRWDVQTGNSHHAFCNYQPTNRVLEHGGTSCYCGIVNARVAYNSVTQTLRQFGVPDE